MRVMFLCIALLPAAACTSTEYKGTLVQDSSGNSTFTEGCSINGKPVPCERDENGKLVLRFNGKTL